MRKLRVETLTAAAFANFGDVMEIAGHTPLNINQGFAQRFDDLAGIDVTLEGGSAKLSIFSVQPRPTPIKIDLMERHPLGSQLFYPLQVRPWLVVVCANPDDVSSFRAFSATGQQGVNYARNTWHFPLLVLEDGNQFIVVDRKGPGNNLEERKLSFALSLQ